MKKIILVLVAVLAVMVVYGCDNEKISKAEAKKMVGTWKVVSVNCPEVLAEKDGQYRTFNYKTDDMEASYPVIIQECRQQVRPGWMVQVKTPNNYWLFPPVVSKRKEAQK